MFFSERRSLFRFVSPKAACVAMAYSVEDVLFARQILACIRPRMNLEAVT